MLKPWYLGWISIFLFQLSVSAFAYDDDDYELEYYSDDVNYQSRQVDDNYYFDDTDDAYYPPPKQKRRAKQIELDEVYSRMPGRIFPPGEKVIVIDPRVHAWGAYSANGELLRSGLATSGANWCSDIEKPCRTSVGTFRIYSLGSFNCVSNKFPINEGGAPMPYCMFFNGGQGLHGSYQVVDGNVSHGCVRMHVDDAEWVRFNFANVGTKVIVKPY